MTIKRFILMSLAVCMAIAAFAQQASFSLIRPRNVVEGRNFSLTFRLSDGEGNPPQAPQLEGCTLLYGPSTSTMQSTQIVNGKMSSTYSVDFTFMYRADRAGTVHVPEVSVSSGGKTLRSSGASFEILPGDAGSQQGGNASRPAVTADDPSTQTPGRVSADDLLVRVSFSKSSVYEQEPVVATIKVYTKYDISSFLVTTQPAFEGFLCEELPVDLETTMEHYNGQNYHTAILKRLLLYPQKSGQLSVNSGKYDVTVVQYEQVSMGFFRTARPVEREVTTSSNAATLRVKALPEPRPAGFTGAVGEFTVSTGLEPELMRTNEASVYSYTIKGKGNIKYLSEPMVEFPAGIDTYTPKTDINANIIAGGTNMAGTYRTDFTIVPQEVGNFTIAGVPFVYFSPEKNEYVTVNVADTPIRVLRGNSAVAAPEQSTIDNTIDDILHIKSLDKVRQTPEVTYTFHSSMYWFLYLLVALILIGVIFIYRRQIKLDADVAGRKLAKAGRVAAKRLKTARTHMQSGNNEAFYQALAQALWGYICDKLNISPSQLTRENVAERLENYGLSAEATANVLDVLDECEMARFTPSHSREEVTGLYEKAEAAVKSIEDVKKH